MQKIGCDWETPPKTTPPDLTIGHQPHPTCLQGKNVVTCYPPTYEGAKGDLSRSTLYTQISAQPCGPGDCYKKAIAEAADIITWDEPICEAQFDCQAILSKCSDINKKEVKDRCIYPFDDINSCCFDAEGNYTGKVCPITTETSQCCFAGPYGGTNICKSSGNCNPVNYIISSDNKYFAGFKAAVSVWVSDKSKARVWKIDMGPSFPPWDGWTSLISSGRNTVLAYDVLNLQIIELPSSKIVESQYPYVTRWLALPNTMNPFQSNLHNFDTSTADCLQIMTNPIGTKFLSWTTCPKEATITFIPTHRAPN